MRWQNYILNNGDKVEPFWKVLLDKGERHLLFIVGHGFDPRMCLGVDTICSAGGQGRRDCFLVEFDYGEVVAGKKKEFIENNLERLDELLSGRGSRVTGRIEMRENGSRSVASVNARRIFQESVSVEDYDDILIDVSAMPRVIGLTAIAVLLKRIDVLKSENGKSVGLHVLVAENPVLDQYIGRDTEEEISDIAGFSRRQGAQASAEIPIVWIPILGEEREPHIRLLYDTLSPDEICPVIPSPSVDPRRGDNIVQEYRELLFDGQLVEPSNIIYASEQNPFEAYRQIYNTIGRYAKVLDTLGGVRPIVSPLSSKLLSVGALLAWYEFRVDKNMHVGLSCVESSNYEIPPDEIMLNRSDKLYSLWIAGECYDS